MMKRKLVTVVAEAVLENRIVEDIMRLGAHGYTIIDVRGEGARGKRASSWEHNRNIRLETVCAEPVAETIVKRLEEAYYAHYAVVVWVSEVEVLRGEKF
jgi:nitrogen regulatory protein P-II 2